jgi:hypothetical protein
MSSSSNSKNTNNNQSSGDDWLGEIVIVVIAGVGKLLWWGARGSPYWALLPLRRWVWRAGRASTPGI